MSSSSGRTPSEDRTIRSHRDALRAAKKAVAEWSAKCHGARDAAASAMIERLGECATDAQGDETLEVVSELFEEYAEQLSDRLAHAIGALALTAHALGRAHAMRLER